MRVARSQALRRRWIGIVTLLVAFSQLAPAQAAETTPIDRDGAAWSLSTEIAGRVPSQLGSIEIRGTGVLSFDPAQIATTRPDLFQTGSFSVFDVLVRLDELGEIDLEYVFDEELQTHVIRTLNDLDGWWYDAHYEGGSFDRTVVRIDQYPVKDRMSIVVYLEDSVRLEAIHAHFREEVARRASNDGMVAIPKITLRSSSDELVFKDITVTSHDVRPDVFQPGVVTMLDVLLSLGEQGLLTELDLEWRTEEAGISLVDGFFVVGIAAGPFAPEVSGACVLTHQIGGATIADHLSPHTHTMSHMHLTADLEAIVSPEAIEWLWICL